MIRAIRAIVNLGDFSFDAYEMPNGERRIGFAGASSVLGHADNWLGRLHKTGGKQLQSIQAMGYSGLPVDVEIFERGKPSGNYGTQSTTISVRDFNKLLGYEALKKKNERAIIVLVAMSEFGLEQTIGLAFDGKSLDRILSKIVHYSQWTHEELMEVLAYNREDTASMILGNIR